MSNFRLDYEDEPLSRRRRADQIAPPYNAGSFRRGREPKNSVARLGSTRHARARINLVLRYLVALGHDELSVWYGPSLWTDM